MNLGWKIDLVKNVNKEKKFRDFYNLKFFKLYGVCFDYETYHKMKENSVKSVGYKSICMAIVFWRIILGFSLSYDFLEFYESLI